MSNSIVKKKTESFLRPSQDLMFSKYWYENEELLVIGRRRLGKTRWASIMLCLTLFYASGVLLKHYPKMRSRKLDNLVERWKPLGRDWNMLFFLPGEGQGEDILFTEVPAAIRSIYKTFPKLRPYELEYMQSKKRVSLLIKGSPIRYQWRHAGIKKEADNKRGQGAEVIVVDEIADHHHHHIVAVVRPMLFDSKGILVATGSAKANRTTQEYRKLYDSQDRKTLLVVDHKKSLELGEITQEELDEVIANDYGGDPDCPIFRQEWGCESDVPVQGAILEHWKRTPCNDYGDVLIAAVDIGWTDAHVVLVAALPKDLKPGRKQLVLINGFKYTKTYTDDIINKIRDFYDKKDIPVFSKLILPHDAYAKRGYSRDTEKKVYARSEISQSIVKAKRYDKEQQIFTLLRHIGNVYVADTFPEELRVDLINWRWNPNKDNTPLHDESSHTGDALTYLVNTAFNAEVWPSYKETAQVKSEMQRFIEEGFPEEDDNTKTFNHWTSDNDKFWSPN